MKHMTGFILMAVILAACAGGSSFGKPNCNEKEGYCVEVRAEEPVLYGEPVTVTVTVTSEKDIPEMGLSLYYDPGTFKEEQHEWEKDVKDYSTYPGGESWVVAVNAKQPLSFTRVLYPQYEEGWFSIFAFASAVIETSSGKTSSRVGDEIGIHLTREGGTVYLANTPLPSHGPQIAATMDPNTLATVRAMPTDTPWPTLTAQELPTTIPDQTLPAPGTPTPLPVIKATETPTLEPLDKTESPPPLILGTQPYPYP
jgi:hypothetical protein